MKYVYGFTSASVDSPVEAVAEAGLVAWCSPWTGAAPEPERELAVAHARVVEALALTGAVLPCPFGTVAPEGELRAWMQAHAVTALAALARLAGGVEFALKLWAAKPVAEPPEGGPASGRAYLAQIRRRAARERALTGLARETAGRFLQELGPLVQIVAENPTAGLLYRAELLVERSSAAAVRERFARFLPGLAHELGARLSGPWPPYYFAGVMVHGRASPAERLPGSGAAEHPVSVERLPG